MKKVKVCITGANGFIGKSLCRALVKSDITIKGFVRSINESMKYKDIEYVPVGDISSKINWLDKLNGYECIIHCAGRSHVMNDRDETDLYKRVNFEATKELAEQAAKAGVSRFIFLSSIKVNGESESKNDKNLINTKIFTSFDLPNPQDLYSISKFQAEKALWEVSAKTGLQIVILRIPLVYGKGVKGNLSRLIKLVNSGIPLPFSLLNNQRSLIGIDNLVDILIRCIDHKDATGKTLMVSDDEDISTPNLLRLIGSAMGRPVRLFPIPISVLKIFSRIFRRELEMNRLIGSLQIDIDYTKKILNCKPLISLEEGIKRMVQSQ